MPADRNRIILDEADRWRSEERITPEFHDWIRSAYPAGKDVGTQRVLQQVLLVVAAILVLVGIVTLVAEFWDSFSDAGKYNILLSFAAIAALLGTAAHLFARTRLLAHILWPLALPLYLFAMTYAQEFPNFGESNPLTVKELATIIGGILISLVALAAGLRISPTLALAAPPMLLAVLSCLDAYQNLGTNGTRALQWVMLGIVVLMHAMLLAIWYGAIRLPFRGQPINLRLPLATNVPWGFVLIMILVTDYMDRSIFDQQQEFFDGLVVAVLLGAVYLCVLGGFALRLGLPELTGVCGFLLIIDAIIFGSDKGGVLGTILAIFAVAVALIVLAQQGVLGHIFKPRPPPWESSPPPARVKGRLVR